MNRTSTFWSQLGLMLMLALAVAPRAFAQQAATQPGAFAAEEPKVEMLRPPSPHWVFVTDGSSYANTAGRVWIIDGDAQRMVGMLSAGYTPSFTMAHDGSVYFVGDTFWSRGARGERSDFITYYDPTSLNVTGETRLPQGRFLTGTKRYALQLSDDGRLLYSANMRPATSVTVIDVTRRAVLAEVPTPGCILVVPHGPATFSSLCSNGSLMTVRVGSDGTAEKKRGEPFFNPDVDPVFDDLALARAAQRAFFVSFKGFVYPVDLSGPAPRPDGQPWPLTSARERGWRPGGTQPIDYHAPTGRIFVLMHRGGEWTQFDPGTEVWVFDAASRRRLARMRVRTPAAAFAVTRDDTPLLFTTDGDSRISIYRTAGKSFRHVDDLEDIGSSSDALMVPGG